MAVSRRALMLFYAVIALLALIGTWTNNLHFVGASDAGGYMGFWLATAANPAAASVTVDLFLLMAAAVAWMLMEARRLNIRWAWLYVVFGALVAISVTFPLFLLHREWRLSNSESTIAGTYTVSDIVVLLLVTAIGLWYTYYSLTLL